MKSVSNSIEEFLTSLFIMDELLSEINFYEHISSLIERSKSNAPNTFNNDLLLIRNINHGNALMSSYGTNFEYIHVWTGSDFNYLPTQAIIYDNNCSCGLYSHCTTQATFMSSNSLVSIPILGLKIGCTPSESFLLSTLECFYDISCLNLIRQYTNSTQPITPLARTAITTEFTPNTTVVDLLKYLFTEQWLTIMNYSAYFEQCSPLLCSYTYIQKFNLLYIVTVLLGFHGGLAIVLKWICPLCVRLIVKIYQYRKNRRNINVHMPPINHNNPIELESTSKQVTVSYVLSSFYSKKKLKYFFIVLASKSYNIHH